MQHIDLARGGHRRKPPGELRDHLVAVLA